MHNHENCCKHGEVKYCEVCKLVYCLKCGKEWRDQGNIWTYTYPSYSSYLPPPNTAASSGGSTNTRLTYTHAHK